MLKTLLLPFKAVWEKSWTKFLGWAQGLVGSFLAVVSALNSYVTDPSFKSYLSVVDVPKSVAVGIATLGLITWLAHGREND